MRLVILGGPGSGKGTQLRALSQALQLPSIAVGEILRTAIVQNTLLGQKAQTAVLQGQLVPDEVMIQFMRLRLLQEDAKVGWIMEGYPRTAFQAEELNFLLESFQQRLDWAIYLEVDEATMLERSAARSRADDAPEILQHRIKAFHERTLPILEYYAPRNRLLSINAQAAPDQVTAEILQKLES
ncbi:MAG: nucleoside monophosphate kinase [Spirulina sp. SIO3F2]|nr:nucleoside monophosphate kinase [Spirulina sp. SIO3F2]